MAGNQSSSHCTVLNTLDLTMPEAAAGWLYTDLETILYLTIIIAIFLIGILSNSAFFFMLVRIPKMRTTVNLYLANLGVCDTVFLTSTAVYYISILIHSPIKENIPFPHKSFCALLFTPSMLGYYASIAIMTAMTVERFLAICHPLTHRYMKGKNRAAKLLSCVWLLSVGPALMTSLRYARNALLCIRWPETDTYQNLPQTMNLCMTAVQDELFNIVGLVVFLAIFFISMIACTIMYAGIIAALNPKKRPSTTNITFNAAQFQLRNQIARMLVITGMLFFMLQLPLRIYSLEIMLRIFGAKPMLTEGHRQLLLIIGRVATLINSGTNSIVYVFFSSYYRKSFQEAFSCTNTKINKNNVKSATVSSSI